MYVIVKEDGMFVAANAGITGASYTKLLQQAKVYPTRNQAMADKCGNESIVPVADAMQPAN